MKTFKEFIDESNLSLTDYAISMVTKSKSKKVFLDMVLGRFASTTDPNEKKALFDLYGVPMGTKMEVFIEKSDAFYDKYKNERAKLKKEYKLVHADSNVKKIMRDAIKIAKSYDE